MSGLSAVAALVGLAFGVSVALTAFLTAKRLERSIRSSAKTLDDLYAPKEEMKDKKRPVAH